MLSRNFFAKATALVFWITVSSATFADELKETLKDLEVGQRWTYNDWESARSAAAKSKKPILALFR